MFSHKFSVQGSAPVPYTVVVRVTSNGVKFKCSCQAGSHGTLCKHVLNLAEGSGASLEAVPAEVSAALFADTALQHRLSDLRAAEAALEALKVKIKKDRQALQRALLGE